MLTVRNLNSKKMCMHGKHYIMCYWLTLLGQASSVFGCTRMNKMYIHTTED